MSGPERTALVTGAGQGIGLSIREVLERDGWTVIGASRHPSVPGDLVMDIRDEASVADGFRHVLSTRGRIDLLVNNASIVSQSRIEECSLREWNDVIETNLTGAFLCCREAIRAFLASGGGAIISLSSIAGRSHSLTASEAYTCSKHAIIGLTKQLARRYATFGIRANCVAPSQTLTPMLRNSLSPERLGQIAAANPTGRLANPGDIAAAVAFLASPGASYVNGAVIDVNGGAW